MIKTNSPHKNVVFLFFSFKESLNTLGRIRLRGQNCLISKEKRRGTVYTRTKTSTRDIFLFERDILLCKKKEEGNGKTVQYQFKEIIKVKNAKENFLKNSLFIDC
jgi:CRISPR/Cas system CSM-associated protein Csm5 (group 7 of RAMP superfamily)